MSIFNLVELLHSGNHFIWTFCNLLPRIFKVSCFNKNETTIMNNTIMISKSEIFSAEMINSIAFLTMVPSLLTDLNTNDFTTPPSPSDLDFPWLVSKFNHDR